MKGNKIFYTLVTICMGLSSLFGGGPKMNFDYSEYTPAQGIKIYTDTIPIKDNYGDHITDPNLNPFDITPKVITKEVTYDPETGMYLVFQKIGDEYYRTPTYLTFEEYLEYKKKEQEREYFNRLAGVTSKKKGLKVGVDPMDRIDVSNSLVDRLFGGTEVNIQPQGQVDVTMQSSYYLNESSTFRSNGNSQWIVIDPDVDIRVSVDGNIGSKLNLGFNYDTQSTFDFDRKIKLDYDTEAFGEDDIIKKIEAGNVSLPLRGSLIQGAQSLFGLKTELQFGHLRLTAIASQQQSERKNIQIEKGAAVQKFEITPDEYDENRHFFLSHYNRETFERNLSNLPQINTSFRISQLEVWISDDRPTYLNRSAPIVALSDLAEPEADKYTNQDPMFLANYGPISPLPKILKDITGIPLPDNRVNPLFDFLISNEDVEDIDKVASILGQQGLVQNRDFEVFNGRKLQPNEYSFNEQLGFISLNIRLRPNQVMAVAYNYTYTANCDEVYNVGNLAADGSQYSANNITPGQPSQNLEPPKVLFTKLIKSSQQSTDNPSWDLMMKNVYPLRATQLDPKEFTFDIFYEDDTDGSLKKYIPEAGLRTQPLLELFNLDRLNKYNDPQADGVFDFVPGVTVIPRSGSVVFPVLEPFGSSLTKKIEKTLVNNGVDPTTAVQIASKYGFQSLYDTSITIARQKLEFNKFVMSGEVTSAFSGEINLGPFVPKNSVRVRAGGVLLVEGQDYEVDYSLGRLRIINDSYLQQGTPINVSFEDQALFSLQQKTMLGLRADYDVNDNFSIGATYLRLFERPFTEKVNIGNDPINNRIFGVDMAYSDEVPFVTKAVDLLPFYSTKAKSTINFSAEAAVLRPGHSKAINNKNDKGDGVLSIDDFEGAVNGLLLGGFNTNQWRLASTPTDFDFEESSLNDNLLYGANRAKLAWYVIDRQARNAEDYNSPYTRLIDQQELFDREVEIGQSEMLTFDLSYYPNQRGPYNFDLPGGTDVSAGIIKGPNGEILLDEPETRWAGIMRNFQNTDFEAANYEFIEFWMLNPFMDRPDGSTHAPMEEGEIIFHLGNVSEDIIKDGLQFYENGIPVDSTTTIPVKETNWGIVPITIPVANGFGVEQGKKQDLGFDGLDDQGELEKYADYVQAVQNAGFNSEVQKDPAADNYNYVEAQNSTEDLLTRFKDLNNPQGNAPLDVDQSVNIHRGNRYPDSEDLNNNKSLDQGEGYYKYVITIANLNGEIDKSKTNYITQDTTIVGRDGRPNEKWYRFRIPLSSYESAKNINGFRSIQFMRMYLTKFSTPKTFRLAEFQLVRNIWRKSDITCSGSDTNPNDVEFTVDEVGLEEYGNKQPFKYITPSEVKEERLVSTFASLRQDEKSLSLNFCNLKDGCQVAINKLAKLDLTLYKGLQLLIHAEAEPGTEIPDGELYAFVRFGKDLVNHYYEYEIPLKISDPLGPQIESNIWPDTNIIDVKFENFKLAKKKRIIENLSIVDTISIMDPDRSDARISVKGTPGLGNVKIIEVGVRNKKNGVVEPFCGEVWVNELRVTGLDERGGYAAQARLQLQMADLGDLNFATNYSSIGWGALDQRLEERKREEILEYDMAANLQLGKLLPGKLGINIPFYAQYSSNQAFQQYDPYERDLTVREKIDALKKKKQNVPDPQQIDDEIKDVRERSKKSTTIKTFNFTNVGISGKGKYPWSPSNMKFSYAFTETNKTDELLKEDKTKEYTAGLNYSYRPKIKPFRPFKKLIKAKALRIIKEINFNFLPNSLTFNTKMNRLVNTRVFRLPQNPVFQFDDKRFLWNRKYGLKWDFTKNLKFTFNATSESIIDELRQTGISESGDPADRKWVDEKGNEVEVTNLSQVKEYRNNNLKNLGRSKNYKHDFKVDYNLPIRFLPYMDWIKVKASYKGDYGWDAGALINIDEAGTPLGNVIHNGQTRSVNGTFTFSKLYSKSKYLKKIERGNKKSRRGRSRNKIAGSDGKSKTKTADVPGGGKRNKNKNKERNVTMVERILIRPLLSLRSIKATYKETFGTMIPGFMPEAKLLGLANGFGAPGYDYALGLQPDLKDFLTSNTQWFNPSPNFNDQISQMRRQDLDVKVSLEPFKDFDISVDFKKSYRKDHTEVFKNKDLNNVKYFSLANYDVGSFEITNMGLSTLFRDNIELYEQFKSNRKIVSNSLPGPEGEHPDWPGYKVGYGPNNYDVAVPAFLSAYIGDDPMTVSRMLEEDISKLNFLPKPNWSVKYDGLSKLDMFKDLLTSFSLTHNYKGTMKVSRFNTTLNYDPNASIQEISPTNGNYYSRIQIPALVIDDQFSPLIGLNLKTKNDITLDVEWRKSRQMALSLEDLREQRNEEFRIGFGYTIKNIKKKKKKGRRRKKDQEKDKANNKKKGVFGLGRVKNNRGRSITINLDFSISDSEELIYEVSQGSSPEINSGQRTIQFSPSVDYDINENLALRFFFDYNDSRSKATTANSNRRLNIKGGVTAQLKIN